MGQVSPWRQPMTTDAEPKDMLDTSAMAGVNGPEDDRPGWDWYDIDWDQANREVRRLRQRIFAASRDGDVKRLRNLQKLALRSLVNAQVSVRRVTEVNAGRLTPGVDGRVVLDAPGKAELAETVQRKARSWTAQPVRRVLVPKRGKKKSRPLGIPVIADRAAQAMVVTALEPEWEARFEPKSYGFRPGRGCQDAIAAIFWTVAGARTKRRWVLDADLEAAFDHVDHDHMLGLLGSFPGREVVAGWLTAGVIGPDGYRRTTEGVPQGGV
ncbi:reverse transcriptase N-terminal domain-containing protein, partial [Parafrankia sp. FMc2]|uniref:reverse transcriptase N-terminal domain-containing protein n=1 Tax=Parafrankia sp. FMc2 TaxID=3233196 RepID=UPI0034D5DBB8